MAHRGAAQTDTAGDLAQEAAAIAADTKALRSQTRSLAQRAAALRDKLEEAGIGFSAEPDQTMAQEGEGGSK